MKVILIMDRYNLSKIMTNKGKGMMANPSDILRTVQLKKSLHLKTDYLMEVIFILSKSAHMHA